MPLKIKSTPTLNGNTIVTRPQNTSGSSVDESVNILAVSKPPFKSQNQIFINAGN